MERQHLEKAIWDEDILISRLFDDVETSIVEYNKLGMQITFIPATAKFAFGIDYEVKLNRDGMEIKTMTNIDLKAVVKPALLKLKRYLTDQVGKNKEHKRKHQDSMDKIRRHISEQNEQLASLQAHVQVTEEHVKREKESYLKEISDVDQELENMENELRRLKMGGTTLAQSAQELKEIEERYDQAVRKNESELERERRRITTTVDVLNSYRLTIRESLAKVEHDIQEHYHQIAATPVRSDH
eukprot:TRINITY_DN9689_c0_g1_i10.p1 TRINITY_DN9689_c0_g1~~TRINITY_DN9689_c0_g1_i10.p1  ORF type:complete len:273 (-),score=38.69 TRINITY_DN9689_c0_g1_i10:51-776(-)